MIFMRSINEQVVNPTTPRHMYLDHHRTTSGDLRDRICNVIVCSEITRDTGRRIEVAGHRQLGVNLVGLVSRKS